MWKSNGGISGLVFIFKKWEKVFPLFLTCFHLLQKDREGGREAGKRERERALEPEINFLFASLPHVCLPQSGTDLGCRWNPGTFMWVSHGWQEFIQ